MPIYEYRCSACGFQKEFLQKVSDPQPTTCPECGKETLGKMVTAAGFQLKGSGWYATDFKGAVKKAPGGDAPKADAKPDAKPETKADVAGASKTEASSDAKPGPAPATPSAS